MKRLINRQSRTWCRSMVVLLSVFIFQCISLGQQVLFPGLTGPDLLMAVQQNYTPALVLSYAEARDTLYANIDVMDDSVKCVYTAFAVYLAPNTDPTATLFNGGLNTEHVYPQGKGATDGTPAHRDMHHLMPSRIDVNQDRGNLPFSEIPDHITDNWYWKDQKRTSIPSSNIDLYSETTSMLFEPREDMKGNIARAVFYIHAIYRDQVMAVDPDFFALQQADLCAWHFQDPIDEMELTRTMMIAEYQDEIANPFVLDCTLARRMYCQGMGHCLVSTQDEIDEDGIDFTSFYDTKTGWFSLNNESQQNYKLTLQLFAATGQMVSGPTAIHLESGAQYADQWYLPPGVYIVHIVGKNKIRMSQVVISN